MTLGIGANLAVFTVVRGVHGIAIGAEPVEEISRTRQNTCSETADGLRQSYERASL